MYKKIRHNQGFTLIELLVVIAIIGVLSAVVLVSLNKARTKGYDANRFLELKQLQTALQIYYTDNGSYPSTLAGTPPRRQWWGESPSGQNKTIWIPGLAPKYISELPKDPVYKRTARGVGGNWGRTYLYMSNGTDYKLIDNNPLNSNVANTPVSSAFYDPMRVTLRGVSWAWQISSSDSARTTW